MQRSLVMTALPLRTRIASVGHRLMQFVQPTHLLSSSVTEWKKIPIAYASSILFVITALRLRALGVDDHFQRRALAHDGINRHFIGVFLHIGQTHAGAEAQ